MSDTDVVTTLSVPDVVIVLSVMGAVRQSERAREREQEKGSRNRRLLGTVHLHRHLLGTVHAH
jgi:hypothetical protein